MFKKLNLKKNTNLFIIIIVIITLSILGIVYFLTNNTEIKNFLMNLSTEIIGAIFIFLIFDYILKSKEKRDKENKKKLAIKQFNKIIFEYIDILSKIYKASSKKLPKDTATISSLFSSEFFEQVKYLDVKSEAPIVIGRDKNGRDKKITWLEYLNFEFKNLDEELNEKLKMYSTFLDDDLLDSILNIQKGKLQEHILLLKNFGKNAIDLYPFEGTIRSLKLL